MQFIEAAPGITQCMAGANAVNAVIIERPDYLVLVDTTQLPKDHRQIRDFLPQFNKQLRYIIITHYHSDHWSGCRFLQEVDTTIIAQEEWSTTCHSERPMLQSMQDKPRGIPVVPPNLVFSHRLSIVDHGIHLYHTPGHSPDQSCVYLPDEMIVITGDSVLASRDTKVTAPYFYWGSSKQLSCSLEFLSRVDFLTIIPGHGPAANRDLLNRHREYLYNITSLFAGLWRAGVCDYEHLINTITPSKCLKGIEDSDFWVPLVHELNVKKLIKEAQQS